MSAWLAVACALLAAVVGWWSGRASTRDRAIAPGRRRRLAERQNATGESLLEMAGQMERHARVLEHAGLPAQAPRIWARGCRRAAVQHLACVNALLMEAGPGAALLAPGPEEAARGGAGSAGTASD